MKNIAELKRRVAPIITDFEQRGIIEREHERFVRVQKDGKYVPGCWRVRFSGTLKTGTGRREASPNGNDAVLLVQAFHRVWRKVESYDPIPGELTVAETMLAELGTEKAHGLLPCAVKVLKVRWPDAATFSAVKQYLPEIVKLYERERRNADRDDQVAETIINDKVEHIERERRRKKALPIWNGMSDDQQEQVWRDIRDQFADKNYARPKTIKRRCLDEIARRTE